MQRAFGTAAKALQVGFAVQAGVRAARLAGAGASADPRALDQWLALVGGDAERLALDGPAVPGGLAVKLFPCCYALQRPIAALRALELADLDPAQVARVVVRTPQSALAPLIHAAPTTGLEGKFSLQYAVAATLLDGRPGIESFTDEAVARPAAQALLARVEVDATPGRRLAAGRRRGDRAHARRRLDAATRGSTCRPARPTARRRRPSWPRRWPTARATWPTRSSRSTGPTPGRSCASGCRRLASRAL